MFRLSLSTFRERWPLFLGAIITVCLGVALVQSSLLTLISATTAEVPAGVPPLQAARMADAYESSVSLMGVSMGFSVFLAVFIVSSTFAFTVAQRRKELALLRMTGASRGQVRRLLLSEALLLGTIGSALGVPVGLVVMKVHTGLIVDLGLLPPGFSARWQDWILGVSGGVGIGVALAGVLVASRRASTVRPLEALRETGAAARVMTASRWFFGLLFLGGAIAMAVIAPHAGPEGAPPLAINAALATACCLALLGPLVVPVAGRVLGVALRGNVLAGLAEANLRDNVRRSAATAAPLLVLVGVLVGQTGATNSTTEAALTEQREHTAGDLVVDGVTGDLRDLTAVPGVALAGVERAVPLTVTHTTIEEDDDGREIEREVDSTEAVVADPGAYARVHTRAPVEGSLADLHGRTVALGPGYGGDTDFHVGDTVQARTGGVDIELRIAAVLPAGMGGGPGFVLPPGAVPPPVLADAPARAVVQVAPGHDADAVAAEIRERGLGTPVGVEDWLARESAAADDTQRSIFIAVLGLAGLYATIAVVNAVVIAAAERRREFAVARVTGLSRGQVVRAALLESWVVTVIGLVLGVLAALPALLAMSAALGTITGFAVLDLPWSLIGATAAGAFVLVGVTSLWTALSATRPRPVTLIGAGE